MQGRHPSLDDLSMLDPELHRSILQIKRCASLTRDSEAPP